MDDALALSVMARILAAPARASMLLALSDGRSLPATELAYRAGISSATASEHLSRMVKAGLLSNEKCGRHRYYRVSAPKIMEALEDLLAAHSVPADRARPDFVRVAPLREARMCYDHLAGRLGVTLTGALQNMGWIVLEGIDFFLTGEGKRELDLFGIDCTSLERSRRRLARRCIDWTERIPHVGGALGSSVAARLMDLDWIRRTKEGRIVIVTNLGRRKFQEMFGITSS